MNNKTFKQLGLTDKMLTTVDKLFFKMPTKIQSEAIPNILNGKNLIGHSQTGSGKTHAYLLPILDQIKPNKEKVQVVITAPTRELAIQIHEEIKVLSNHLNTTDAWKTKLIIGGTDREKLIKQLKNPPQIVVGTPGRIFDMVDNSYLSIYETTSFVIDEADLMVEMNFMEAVDKLLVRCQKNVQLLAFSATFPQELQIFLKKYMQQPIYIKIDSNLTPDTLEHRLIDLKHRPLEDKLLDITKIIQPYVALIFVNSKEKADEIYAYLNRMKLNVGVLHGGLSSRERTKVVKDILNLKYEYIVATDLASRGIDIKGTSHVINAELPKETEFYIHRSGRTARAGHEGTVINLYNEGDLLFINKLEEKGINFIFSEIKDGEFAEVKHFNQRAKRKNTSSNIDREAWKMVRKKRKVKPGYKKKMKQEQEKIKRNLKRSKYKK